MELEQGRVASTRSGAWLLHVWRAGAAAGCLDMAVVQTGWRHFANKTSVLRKNRNSPQMIDWLRNVRGIEPDS